MITKTLNLDSAQQQLFAEINAKSGGTLNITNMEDFFGNLLDIAALGDNNEGLKYLRLPVDEPIFEINANTRKIEIPSDFKSNGLSVQGDHLAEIVFFSIDRYFDYMDFMNCDVTINWKMGTQVGRTESFLKNSDMIAGHVVFGWPVNNIITEKSGQLSFAIEFSIKDKNTNEVKYSFNTLTANINIKDGLIIGEAEPVSLQEDILSILANSKFGEGTAAVGSLTWLTGNGQGLVEGTGPDTNVTLLAYNETINLDTEIDSETGLPHSIPINVYAEAFVDSGTEVVYMNNIGTRLPEVYSKAPLNLIEVQSEDIEVGKTYYNDLGEVLTNDELINAEVVYEAGPLDTGLKYFVKTSENPVAYRLATDEEVENRSVDLYMRLAKLPISEAGTYIIKAQGQKFQAQEIDGEVKDVKIGAGDIVSSGAIIVPAVEVPSDVVIEKNQNASAFEGYSFDEESSANVIFLSENSDNNLVASAVVNNPGALQFVWKKQNGNNYEAVSEDEVPFQLENSSSFAVTEEGRYIVEVNHFKNGQTTSSPVASDPIIASQLAGKITEASISYKDVEATNFGEVAFGTENANIYINSNSITQLKKYQLRFDDCIVNGIEGEIAYEWYRSVDDSEENAVFFSDSQVLDIPAGDFCYFAKIKNKYNGSIYTYSFKPIQINDRDT